MKLLMFAILAVIVLAAACKIEGAVSTSREAPAEVDATSFYLDGYLVQDFRLRDGTHCVALARSGGITCNWTTP
jgi:hypothetical protein